MIENLVIIWNTTIWSVLKATYTRIWTNQEWATQFQRYIDWYAVEWMTDDEIVVNQAWTFVIAVLPVDNQWNEWEIEYSEWIVIIEEIEKPIQKEYIVKTYDTNFDFVKIIPTSIITNDISYSESINAWQWELVLNLNLPIDTDFFENIKYVRVYCSDNRTLNNELLYTWYLSKYSRLFSNNKENVQATFLSIYSLMNDIVFQKNWTDEFTLEWVEPSSIIKQIIDYFNTQYSWIITYTEDSIVSYSWVVNVECKNNKCSEVISNILDWLNYYFYCWADWICYFKPKPTETTHAFTYQKDITALTIPEDFEQVVNAVRVQYWYIWWNHHWFTDRAVNQDSIDKYGRKEQTITNQNIYWNEAAEIYRDSILNKYAEGKKNISITVNTRYEIESIHPWDTIKIRNLWLNINWLQVNSVNYQYEQVVLKLEYTSTLAQEIFSSNNL